MGISKKEFEVTMETYGARRLEDIKGPEGRSPCFIVGGVEFAYFGSHEIVQRKKKVAQELIERAMAEFGEEYPDGGKNFCYDTILSVKGILTLVAMIEGKYSKELVHKLAGETYKKLFDCALIRNVEKPFQKLVSPRMEKLSNLLTEYDNVVNPYGAPNVVLKNPVEYMDIVSMNIEPTKMQLTTERSTTKFYILAQGLSYQTEILHNPEKGEKSGYITMYHNYSKYDEDEIVNLSYNPYGLDSSPDDISMVFSLITGKVWKKYHKEEAIPATDEQINACVFYLKETIDKVKTDIINNMVYEK